MENQTSQIAKKSLLKSQSFTTKVLIKKIFTIVVLSLFSLLSNAQNKAKDILGNYVVPSKDGAIQIYESNGKFYGKITLNKDASKLDINNPDAEKQKRKVLGLNILTEFTFDGDDTWENGSIYDPKNGKTYSCKITQNANGDLNIRGFIGFSLLGRTEIFTKIKS
jgi:uncharacterized protein (DUF2147 family)